MKRKKENKREMIIPIIVITALIIIPFLITERSTDSLTGFAIFQSKEITKEDFEIIRTSLTIPSENEQIVLSKNILNLKEGDKAGLIIRFLNPSKGRIATKLEIIGEENFFNYDKEVQSIKVNEFHDWDIKIDIPTNQKDGEYSYRIEVGGRTSNLVLIIGDT